MPSIVTSCRPANHKRKQYWSKLHSCRPIRNILEGHPARARQPGAREPDADAHEPGAHDSTEIALPCQNRAGPRSHYRTQPPRYREARRLGRADPAVSFPLDGFATLSPCRHVFKRYTRSPSRSNERTLRLCFDTLREMKPRTVWACQPVWLRICSSGRRYFTGGGYCAIALLTPFEICMLASFILSPTSVTTE